MNINKTDIAMKKLLFLLSALIFILLIFSTCSSEDETQKCKLIVTSSNETLGTVTGGGIYENGTIVTIEAIEKEGKFEKWDDGSTDNPRQVIVTKDCSFVAQFVRLSPTEDPTLIPINPTLLIGKWERDWNNPTFEYNGGSFTRVLGFQFNEDYSGFVYLDNYNGSGTVLNLQTEWTINGMYLQISTPDGKGHGSYTCFEQSENKISLNGVGHQFGLIRSYY
jgi:hypothetical protein